jgi:hypothetical protein
VEGDVSSV